MASDGLSWPQLASVDLNLPQFESMASIDLEWPRLILNVLIWNSNCMKMYVFDIITMFTWVQNNEVFEHANLQKIFCNKEVKRIWISWFYNSFPQLVIIPSYWDDCTVVEKSPKSLIFNISFFSLICISRQKNNSDFVT